jgi:hypothetical protein
MMKNDNLLEVTCAICGSSSLQYSQVLSGFNEMLKYFLESTSLDKDTLKLLVQECPFCRYCAPDLATVMPGVNEIICTESYRLIADNIGIPALIRRYMLYSYCAEMLKEDETALFGYLVSSWICDDLKDMKSGRRCRLKAIEWMLKCKEKGVLTWKEPGVFEFVLGELYRRTADFEKGSMMVKTGLNKVVKHELRSGLELTGSRIDRWDTLP